MAIIEENGKRYEIKDGRVVAAAVLEYQEEDVVERKPKDRVIHGKKIGTVISTPMESVYGTSVGVHFDDGSFAEVFVEELETAPQEKVAHSDTPAGFEAEYLAYRDMPANDLDELEFKADKARELNARAKALQTNSKNSLSDQILFDQVVTATAVDIMDFREASRNAHVAAEGYLENLPKFRMSETIGQSGNGRGDASWLDNVEVEESQEADDAQLAQKADQIVSRLSPEQLDDKDLMKQALSYAFADLDSEQRTRLAGYVNEARRQKLTEKPVEKVAKAPRDMDGNEINLDDVPFEAIFGA